MADDYALAYKKVTELALEANAPASGDWGIRWDTSAGQPVRVAAENPLHTVGTTASLAELNMAADNSANTEIVTTTNAIAAAESGTTYILNSATAFVSTLPALAAGLRYTFYAGATQVTGGNHTIVPTNDNTIFGDYNVAGATVPASAEGSINWVADTMLPGDKVEVFCDGTNWYVSGSAAASGAITFTT
jgi:hypothetical protein|tara:strand:+ start:7772 stop:8341 length:570 start_codon:yes stop_codon:yes gene_type:complete